jgi:hypothetical protein
LDAIAPLCGPHYTTLKWCRALTMLSCKPGFCDLFRVGIWNQLMHKRPWWINLELCFIESQMSSCIVVLCFLKKIGGKKTHNTKNKLKDN